MLEGQIACQQVCNNTPVVVDEYESIITQFRQNLLDEADIQRKMQWIMREREERSSETEHTWSKTCVIAHRNYLGVAEMVSAAKWLFPISAMLA